MGSAWPGKLCTHARTLVCVCVCVGLQAGRLHWGNVNSLCGSMGTVFHLPSRNCSNEARHIAFHPSLPAIRHSSQFSLWPQQSVCIHRDNAVGPGCPPPPPFPTPLRSSVRARAIPPPLRIPAATRLLRIPGKCFRSSSSRCGCCVCATPPPVLQLRPTVCQRMPRKVICS